MEAPVERRPDHTKGRSGQTGNARVGGLRAVDDAALVEALRAYGVRHLSGNRAIHANGERSTLSPSDLLAHLAQSEDPRLRHAITARFLRRPELADAAPQAAAALPPAAGEQLMLAYAAAVYLQRLWWNRWRRYLGDVEVLPPCWIEELGLPAPEERCDQLGLAALATRDPGARRNGMPRRPRGRSTGLGIYLTVGKRLMGQLIAEVGACRAARAS